MYAFIVDNLLCGDNGQPQILAATGIRENDAMSSQIIPIGTEKFLPFRKAAVEGEGDERLADSGNIWQTENLYDMGIRLNFGESMRLLHFHDEVLIE